MGIKSTLSKPFAKLIASRIKRWSEKPIETQEKVFRNLLNEGAKTAFGKDHSLSLVRNYQEYKNAVPIRDYEGLKPYIERVKQGEPDVLWKGKPLYLSKTSGTTSGIKYIPITKESIPNHINAARDAILMYVNQTGKSAFTDGKMIFLSGSPELDTNGAIPAGRLSGIVNHYVPAYLRSNQEPSYKTNCIHDWEQKVDAIVEETINKNMTLISGIPPWVQMYFDRLIAKKGVPVKDIFPNFSLFIYGGVNYEPYRAKLENAIGKKVDSIELYPASEGFIAFQDSQEEEGMLLLLNSGIFYEFIPLSEYFNANPTRISLKDVQVGINYAVILTTNAGLWSYSIGDTVRFVSINPYKLVVTGRIKHFLSAFGEHVISEEVEKAMSEAAASMNVQITEFTVAPQLNPAQGLPHHEWLVEFSDDNIDINAFADKIDSAMQRLNIYYKDLIEGNVIQHLKITALRKDAFIEYMKSKGKLGGQNKVPRLSNDREIAEELSK